MQTHRPKLVEHRGIEPQICYTPLMARPKKYPPQITRQCPCGKEFKPPMKDVNRGNGKFCSRGCAQKHQRRPQKNPALHTTLTCNMCGEQFSRRISNLFKSKSGLRFCSRKCKDQAQRLESGIEEIHPPHYGTAGEVHSYTYREIAFRHHPAKCNRCGYDRYKSVLRVHHIDRDRTNRDPDNLEVLCPTCHEEEHYLANDGVYNRIKLVDLEGLESSTSPVQTGCYSF